uniref:DNA polymerase alpha catalytic subunit (inferred by orthology to a human protein) n=1 Tax=Anisakis simplex TaxID=6269 RepID=A0A0M3KE16_ANISI
LSFTRQGAVCPKCMNGIMKREKSSRLLYEQQSFFEALFDLTKALSECNTEQQKKLRTRKDVNEVLALNAALLKVCQEQLSRNDFNRISLTRLFASMRTTAAAGFVGGA